MGVRSTRRLVAVGGALAAILLGAPVTWADGLLYKPGDILIAVRQAGGVGSFDGVVDLDPNTLQLTTLAQGGLLDSGPGPGGIGPSGLTLDANGDMLVVVVPDTGGAHVVRIDGQTADQSEVITTVDETASAIFPARIVDQLYIPASSSIFRVDVGTGSTSQLTVGGFLYPNVIFVTAESDATLLTGSNSSLVRVALDTRRQSLVENLSPAQISGVVLMGSTPVLATDEGVIELDPLLGPTILLFPTGVPGIGIAPDQSLVVNGGGDCFLSRISPPYTQSEPLLTGLPGESCHGFIVAPARPPAGGPAINWVFVGNPGNAADAPSNCLNSPDCGSVSYSYYIDKYEVTNAQYVAFLNAKAASDPYGLYNTSMDTDAANGGITQSGSSGSYTYSVKAGFENKPVTWVSFYDALRYANWLNNGRGTADTETGAYTITPDAITNNTITRNPGAITFLTNENEWYKAAYYDPISQGYFAYPAGTSTPTVCAAPGSTANTANCNSAVGAVVTDVGSYTASASPSGTFDQGGNVFEWNEEIVGPSGWGFRGGSWEGDASNLAASSPSFTSSIGSPFIGFRVASLVPEPGARLLGTTALLCMGALRKRQSS